MPRRRGRRKPPPSTPLTRPERWALVLLILGPVLIMPGALDRFVFAKVAAVAAGAAVAAAGPSRGSLPRVAKIGLAAGAVVLVLAAALGAAPIPQLIGRAPRYEGFVVLPVYLAAGLSGARILGPDRAPESAKWAVRLIAVASLAVGLVALAETVGLRPLSSNVYRPGSLLGNASDEGAFGVLVLGPLAALAVGRRDRWAAAGATAAVMTIVASASRGALAAALVVVVLLLLLLGGRRQRMVVIAGLALLVGGMLATPFTRSRILGSSPLAGQTVSGRFLLWEETLSLIAHHPVLGVGPSGFEDAIVGYHDLRWQREVGPANPPDSPHDWVLQAADAGGLPLALLAIALAGYTGLRGLELARRELAARAPPLAGGLLVGLIGYGVALSAHLTSPGPTSLAALFGGVLLAGPPRPAARKGWSTAILIAAPAAFALFLLLAGLAEIPLRSAIVALDRGDLTGAQQDFTTAETLRPWDVAVDLTAGHAFAVEASDGNRAAAGLALGWLQAADRQLPGSEQVVEDLATVDSATGDYPAATRLLSAALLRDPDNPQLLLSRGVLYAEQADYPPAVQDLLAASRISPTSPQPWADLALVYRAQGHLLAARHASARAARLRVIQAAS